MAKFCNVQKFKNVYEHQVGTQFDNAIHEMEKEQFCTDILDKIRDEILEYIDDLDIAAEICDIFDKYKESGDKE